jgi:hypothetical protein
MPVKQGFERPIKGYCVSHLGKSESARPEGERARHNPQRRCAFGLDALGQVRSSMAGSAALNAVCAASRCATSFSSIEYELIDV